MEGVGGCALLLNGNQDNDRLVVQGREELAGRGAWSVKATNSETGRQVQVWFDQDTGFILRHRILGSSSYAESFGLPDEVRVRAVAFDVVLPPGLFDPSRGWVGGFAVGASGKRE